MPLARARAEAEAILRRARGVGDPGGRRWAAAHLAVHEALVNAVVHGHRGDEDVPVAVTIRRGAGRCVVEIADRALAGAWTGPEGRGWRLIRAGTDAAELRMAPGRSVVGLRWDIARRAAASPPDRHAELGAPNARLAGRETRVPTVERP
ncbi:MAG: ATP-binding protein [Nitriliruptoraceae bacterium]|nr:ATP-binding protein [Nitriliruptoraceae bacterium]